MNRLQLIGRVRSITRDLSNAIFREVDIVDYINEGIDRMRQVIPELEGMKELESNTETPKLLPKRYHHLLSLYSASRCFGQDERHYQSTNYMNEFEQKLDEMKQAIESGQVKIVDETGTPVVVDDTLGTDYVRDTYFETKAGYTDVDEGVEGV